MNGRPMKARLWVSFSAFVLLVAILIWRQCFAPPVVAYDCPDHDVNLPPINSGDTAWSQVPLAGAITGIAEFHDCQRLISLSNSNAYGPLVGIWVSEVLDQLPDSLAKLHLPTPGYPGAVVSVVPAVPESGLAISPTAVGVGLPFAQIFAWPESQNVPPGYRPLGIARGWNCLYIFLASPSGYSARMVPVNDAETCTHPVRADTLDEGKALNVSTSASNLPVGSYPPVGRWEWDGQQHYIGLGCHKTWCEVSDPDVSTFAPSVSYSLPTGATDLERRVFEVKGWYDEQRLAVVSSGGLGLTPASYTGTAIPDTGLDAIDNKSSFQATWVPVAQVALEVESAEYAQKLNFHLGKLPRGTSLQKLTQVSLCTGTASACFPDGGAPTCDFSDSDGEWWAKVVAPNGETKYHCGTRVDHSGLTDSHGVAVHIPGAARWKWSNTDEQLWVRCAQGCCAVH